MVTTLQFTRRTLIDRPLIAKINAITPYLYKGDPHRTARFILDQACDRLVKDLGVDYQHYLTAMAAMTADENHNLAPSEDVPCRPS